MHCLCSGIFNINIDILDYICIVYKGVGIDFIYVREPLIAVFVEPELSPFWTILSGSDGA